MDFGFNCNKVWKRIVLAYEHIGLRMVLRHSFEFEEVKRTNRIA